MVFLALAVAVIGSRWAKGEKMAQALQINRIARWVYVGFFGLVVVAAMII
jgi:hypothetical protein